MRAKPIFLILLVITVVYTNCKNDKTENREDKNVVTKKGSSKRDNLNISIFLDLSDRIDPIKYGNSSMEFYLRDLGYIESISKGFEKHLMSKRIVENNDQIQLYFDPEPSNRAINNLAKELKLSYLKSTTTKDMILGMSQKYISNSREIYRQAIEDKNYVGSDIWGFFKSKVSDYCIKPNHRNILFILTDGYMFFKDSNFMIENRSSYITPQLIKLLGLNTANYSAKIRDNGYSFIKTNEDLSSLEIVLLGVNPAKGNPFEGDVINEYWSKWFNDMKVKKYIIKQTDLPSNLDPIIQAYINR
ncbi:MAG: hypothetical protein EOO43_04905 [Flavobacterium sp.]|nr:MAG: hypothetical protein EOO43_04905 [Flavobacterium sp.]